jgi:PAS domain S-box-containing protein
MRWSSLHRADKSCYSARQMISEIDGGASDRGTIDTRDVLLPLLAASGNGLLTANPAREVTSWEGAAGLIFGWQARDIVGRKLEVLFPEDGLEKLFVHCEDPKEAHVELNCRTKNGKTKAVEVWSRAAEASQGRHLLVRDVTELKFLEHAFLDAAEQEQRRIGRQMHDHLSQHILGAAFAVKALAADLDREGSRYAGQLHDLARLVNEAVVQVRDISHGFHPAELERGLPAALQGLAVRINQFIPCELRCETTGAVEPFDLVLHAYRIAREMADHALHETGATKISIRLSGRAGFTRLTITDDGSNEGPLTRDPDHPISKTLLYCAKAVQGHLRVKFHGGVGTSITCTFPESS